MKLSEQLTTELGKAFVFERFRPGMRSYFMKAGFSEVNFALFGIFFWLSVAPTALLFIFKIWPWIVAKAHNPLLQFAFALLSWTAVHGVVIGTVIGALYFYLDLQIFSRTKKIELVLPDFLRLVSENLKGGMPFERALWNSIKPEFGVLANEVRLAAKKVITGQDVEDALLEFTNKYDSRTLRRSFELIIEGIKGGGRTADTIDRTIETIEETQELKAEMTTTNLAYIIFVVVIIVFVAPGLFTLSFQFLSILTELSSRVAVDVDVTKAGLGLPIGFGGNIAIEPESFKNFSRWALLVLALFSAMIISQISKGSIKGGVKYIPFIMVSSQIMHFIFMTAATAMFKGITGG